MRKFTAKENKINIVFSSFLIIGYIICAYFFSTMAKQIVGPMGMLLQAFILFLFGLLLFYATRVGEGRQVRRFSLAVLLLVDIPALYIIMAAFIRSLPFSAAINPAAAQQAQAAGQQAPAGLSVILMLACVALGYALPYTFFSGYELRDESEKEAPAAVEGGIAEELAETEAETAAEDKAEDAQDDTAAADAEEAVKEAEETAEETAEEAVEEAVDADDTEEKKEEE